MREYIALHIYKTSTVVHDLQNRWKLIMFCGIRFIVFKSSVIHTVFCNINTCLLCPFPESFSWRKALMNLVILTETVNSQEAGQQMVLLSQETARRLCWLLPVQFLIFWPFECNLHSMISQCTYFNVFFLPQSVKGYSIRLAWFYHYWMPATIFYVNPYHLCY